MEKNGSKTTKTKKISKEEKEKFDNKGHRKRIRERFYNNEIEHFDEYEILELLLTYCIPRKNTKVIAKELLRRYKTLKSVFKAEKVELCTVEGIGDNTALFLTLLGKLETKRVKDEIYKGEMDPKENSFKILNKEKLLEYLKDKIGYNGIEKFYVIYLSSSNEVLDLRETSSGTLDRSSVYFREIYKNVIKLRAKSVIIAHNHPSGNITPSKSDIQLTNELAKGLKNFDATLIEHIIISKDTHFSFLAEGLI